MKIVFFGSSDFSVPSLEFCVASKHKLVAVITTPDQPKGRGLRTQPNPVKERCAKLSLLTFAPRSLRDTDVKEKISTLKPDVFIVASYGKLIPESWLGIPSQAALNIHPSLLPKYRGAAPIPWQILNGEKETGVSVAMVTKDLDAGDIVHQIRIPLEEDETTVSLTERLAQLAREALEAVILKLEKGRLDRIPQREAESSYARKLSKTDGYLDINESAIDLERKIRAFHPWPGAFVGFSAGGWPKVPLRILEVKVDSIACAEAKAGTLLEVNSKGFLRLQTGKGSLQIFKVQMPGRRAISGNEFANGQRLKTGTLFEKVQ